MNHHTAMPISRRRLLRGAAATGLLTLATPGLLRAEEAIRLGALVPLTGAGGTYGTSMAAAIKGVIDEVNGAGGILGRTIALTVEDDQSNPEAAVRAAHKLIGADRVSAIMATWQSAVTTAIAPLCWESRTFLGTVSAADSITALPHQGFIIRTQATSGLYGRKFGEFAVELGSKNMVLMTPQTPFTEIISATVKKVMTENGGKADVVIYDEKKPTLRSELDVALRSNPDVLLLGGYAPDTTVLVKDIFRSGYKGKVLAWFYAVDQKVIDSLPAEVVEGIYTISQSPVVGDPAYKRLAQLLGVPSPDSSTAQAFDIANLVTLAIAAAGSDTGEAIKDNIRKISQGGGKVVDNAVDGIAAIKAGEKVDYNGASGPCEFDEKGDTVEAKFRYEQVRAGKKELIKIA